MAEQTGVLRYRRKPRKRADEDGLTVTRYEPGKPLDRLAHVAQMSSSRAELAEVPLPSGTVLLVRHTTWHADEPSTDWEVIEAGDYLAYSHTNDSLFDTDEADLRQFYDLAEEKSPEPDPALLEPDHDEPAGLAADLTPFLDWPLYFPDEQGPHCDNHPACKHEDCNTPCYGPVYLHSARRMTIREFLADIKAHAEGAS